MRKTCTQCGLTKPFGDFYAHSRMADGFLSACKECTKKAVRANREKKIDYYRAYDRARGNQADRVAARLAYSKTSAYRESCRKAKPLWIARNQDKRAAHVILGNAVRAGRIIKQPCSVCGSRKRIHGHHDDYSKPLEVIWLCPFHHAAHHKALRGR